MAIRQATRAKTKLIPGRAVRTTLAIPRELVEAVDGEVAGGRTRSRTDFVIYAIEMELWRRRERAIDDQYAEGLADPEYIAEAEQIMKEFESADAETARMIDEEWGPWEATPE
jgi:Arc/MetJ-type ribon-helix-helix transcriptional regulator